MRVELLEKTSQTCLRMHFRNKKKKLIIKKIGKMTPLTDQTVVVVMKMTKVMVTMIYFRNLRMKKMTERAECQLITS